MRAFHKLNNLSILLPEIVFAHEIEVPVEGRRVVDETVVAERTAEPASQHTKKITSGRNMTQYTLTISKKVLLNE